MNAFATGTLTLGFVFGAYLTETFQGAILAIPRGKIEAGQACGRSCFQVVRHIMLPQMIRRRGRMCMCGAGFMRTKGRRC